MAQGTAMPLSYDLGWAVQKAATMEQRIAELEKQLVHEQRLRENWIIQCDIIKKKRDEANAAVQTLRAAVKLVLDEGDEQGKIWLDDKAYPACHKAYKETAALDPVKRGTPNKGGMMGGIKHGKGFLKDISNATMRGGLVEAVVVVANRDKAIRADEREKVLRECYNAITDLPPSPVRGQCAETIRKLMTKEATNDDDDEKLLKEMDREAEWQRKMDESHPVCRCCGLRPPECECGRYDDEN